MGLKFSLPSTSLFHYKSIDREHGQLVGILNSITQEFAEAESITGARCAVRLREFQHALELHFAHEEQEMSDADYPGLEAHRVHHVMSLSTLIALCSDVATKPSVDLEIVRTLFELLLDELLRHDLMFKEYLESQGFLAA